MYEIQQRELNSLRQIIFNSQAMNSNSNEETNPLLRLQLAALHVSPNNLIEHITNANFCQIFS